MSRKIELMFRGRYVTVEISEKQSWLRGCDAKCECSICNSKPRSGWTNSVPFDSIEIISIERSKSLVDKNSYDGRNIIEEIKKLEKKVICERCRRVTTLISYFLPESYESF